MDFFMEDLWGDESSLAQVMDDYESWKFIIANLLWIHLVVCGVSKVTLITESQHKSLLQPSSLPPSTLLCQVCSTPQLKAQQYTHTNKILYLFIYELVFFVVKRQITSLKI